MRAVVEKSSSDRVHQVPQLDGWDGALCALRESETSAWVQALGSVMRSWSAEDLQSAEALGGVYHLVVGCDGCWAQRRCHP